MESVFAGWEVASVVKRKAKWEKHSRFLKKQGQCRTKNATNIAQCKTQKPHAAKQNKYWRVKQNF